MSKLGPKSEAQSNILALNSQRTGTGTNSTQDEGGRASGEKRRKILARLQQQATKQLLNFMAEMFNQTDDKLFELANNFGTGDNHLIYFESMRQLRLRRKGIEQDFIERINRAFSCNNNNGSTLSDAQDGSLSLIDDCSHEIQVAISAMENKGKNKYARALAQLEKRIDFLAEWNIDETNNPLGLGVICNALSLSCRDVDMNLEVQLVFFKLFDNYLISQLGPLYDKCNIQLAKIGILPDIKPQSWRNPTPTTKVKVSGRVIEKVVQETVNSIFSNMRSSIASSDISRHYGDNVHLLPNGKAPEFSLHSVIGLLCDIQQLLLSNAGKASAKAFRVDGSDSKSFNIIKLVEDILAEKGGQEKHSFSSKTNETIALVEMLFNFSVNDSNLYPEMKALIIRLQIPILKVALNDDSFFGLSNHPARALINELAAEALSWSPNEILGDVGNDPVYKKIENVVNKVLSEFEENVDIFEEIAEEFVSTRKKQQHVAALTATRTVACENGKAKTDLAKKIVTVVLNEKIQGNDTPVSIEDFLKNTWSRVMFLQCLKFGDGSKEFLECSKFTDKLLESVAQVNSLSERLEHGKRSPQIKETLNEYLNEAGISPAQIKASFDTLDAIHEKILSKAAVDKDSANRQDETVRLPKQAYDSVDHLLGGIFSDEPPAALKTPFNEDYFSKDALEKLESLEINDWLDIKDKMGQSIRCQLASIVYPDEDYIFVDRSGRKTMEMSKHNIAQKIEDDTLTTLDSRPLVDRAFDSIMANLNQQANGNPMRQHA